MFVCVHASVCVDVSVHARAYVCMCKTCYQSEGYIIQHKPCNNQTETAL